MLPIGNDDRRVHVTHAEYDAECLKFAYFGRLDQIGDLVARCFADHTRRLQIGPKDLASRLAEVVNSLGDGSFVYRTAFDLVAREQIVAAPTAEVGGRLPSKIDRVADPHVHTEAAERWMQMTGVAGKVNAPARIAIGDEAVRDPQIGADDINGEIAQPGPAADDIRSIDGRRIDIIGKLSDHEGPQALLVHRAEEGRHFFVKHPVHDSRAVNLAAWPDPARER